MGFTIGTSGFALAVVLFASTFVKTAADEGGQRRSRFMRLLGLAMILNGLHFVWRTMPESLEIGLAIAGLALTITAIWPRLWVRRAS